MTTRQNTIAAQVRIVLRGFWTTISKVRIACFTGGTGLMVPEIRYRKRGPADGRALWSCNSQIFIATLRAQCSRNRLSSFNGSFIFRLAVYLLAGFANIDSTLEIRAFLDTYTLGGDIAA